MSVRSSAILLQSLSKRGQNSLAVFICLHLDNQNSDGQQENKFSASQAHLLCFKYCLTALKLPSLQRFAMPTPFLPPIGRLCERVFSQAATPLHRECDTYLHPVDRDDH